MSPPAATAAARRTARAPARRAGRREATRAAPRIPRRVSGPLRARTDPRPVALPIGVRLAAFATTLPDRGIVDRLVRGRAWIAVVGTLLIGLVAMQVSLLKLNAGIGGAVERAAALERTNGELRAQVSQLESGERIQERAAALGMVMPPAGQISYLRAGGAGTAGAAAEALRQQSFNDPAKAQPLPGVGGSASGDTSPVDTTTSDGTSTDGTSTAPSTGPTSTGTSGNATSGDTPSTGTSSTDTSSTAGTAPGATPADAASAGGTSGDPGAGE